MKTLLMLLVVVAACGGKSSVASPKGGAAMSPEMTRFHDVIAPRWHADKGAQRMQDTCTAIPQLQTNADALAKSKAPSTSEPASWSTGTKELVDAVGALDATCKANSATEFEPAFEHVHTVFHALMELGGGEHMEPGEQMEHGEKMEHGHAM